MSATRESGEAPIADSLTTCWTPARRAAFEAGELIVFALPLLRLEIFNVAGRCWRCEGTLVELAAALDELGFELIEPELARVAAGRRAASQHTTRRTSPSPRRTTHRS